MSAVDEARLRELAEALTFFGRYADETREATATRRNNNANDASKAILALLDALSAERDAHMEYRTTADLLIASLKADLRAERERADRAVIGWIKRINEQHPIGLTQPSDWKFSPHKPALGEGLKAEWFDVHPVFLATQKAEG